VRKQTLIGTLVLISASAFLGATVFHEEIAQAAQLVSAEIIGPLDAQGNVKVHEQGTADVNITNRAVTVTGTVDINETTSKLLDTGPSGVLVSAGAPPVAIGTIDTASMSQVRVAADLRSEGECAGLVRLRAAGPAGELLSADLTNGLNEVIDIPGPELSFSLQNEAPSGSCIADVTVWGR
jgi:hypothetical protein